MTFASDLIALLARLSPQSERDVTSNLTIHQEALFPYLVLPAPLRLGPAAGVLIQNSIPFQVDRFRPASSGVISTQWVKLAAGVWRMEFQWEAFSDYFSSIGTIFTIQLVIDGSLVDICSANTWVANALHQGDRTMTITLEKDTVIQDLTGATAAAQTHGYHIRAILTKLN